MAEIERLTITLSVEMAALIRDAVDAGGYASSSEVVREALHYWTAKRAAQSHELATLKADLDRGLADLAHGRTMKFDAARIIERGRILSTSRSHSD